MKKPVVYMRDAVIAGAFAGTLGFLIGVPTNHPNRLPEQSVTNGHTVRTSPIVKISWHTPDDGVRDWTVETKNTVYMIGNWIEEPPLDIADR